MASGHTSTAMGSYTKATGRTSAAMGTHTTASGETSTAIGAFTVASGRESIAMGTYTVAQSATEVTLGRYNELSHNPDPNEWNAEDAILRVGNGTSNHRSDALRVMKSGVTHIKALHATTLAIRGADVMAIIEIMSAAIVQIQVELKESRAMRHADEGENTARFGSLRTEFAKNIATDTQNDADLADATTDPTINEEDQWDDFWAPSPRLPFSWTYRSFLESRIASMKLAFPDFRDYIGYTE